MSFPLGGTHIDGFQRVHKGFKDRIFPDDVSDLGNFRPYDTISLSVKTLSKHLRKSNKFPDTTKVCLKFIHLQHSSFASVHDTMLMEFLAHRSTFGSLVTLSAAPPPVWCIRGSSCATRTWERNLSCGMHISLLLPSSVTPNLWMVCNLQLYRSVLDL